MKKGFTLIEMLGVIVILSVIGLITVPIVSNVLNTSNDNLTKDQKELIKSSARVYVAERPFADYTGENKNISVDKLIDEGYLNENEELRNQKYYVEVTKDGSNFKFEVKKQ